MKQDEIIEMAKQAGFLSHGDSFYTNHRYGDCILELEAFAELVAAKATDEANARSNASWALMCKKMVEQEREACALSCENLAKGWKENPSKDDSGYIALSNAALFIRARAQAERGEA